MTRFGLGSCSFLVRVSARSSLLYCAGISAYPRALELIVQTRGITDRVHLVCFHGYLSLVRAKTDTPYAESHLEGRLVGGNVRLYYALTLSFSIRTFAQFHATY